MLDIPAKSMEHTQPHHEKILHAGIAYCYKGPTVIIGTMSLTTRRLVFTTHRLNFSQFTIVIPLEQIGSVTLKNHLRIFNHGMMVTQKNGAVDTFAVWKRKRWSTWIQNAMQNTQK